MKPRGPVPICLVSSVTILGCYGSSTPGGVDTSTEPDTIAHDTTSDLDARDTHAADPSDDCVRDPLICDAIYTPYVTFSFMDASTGTPYCGPAAVAFDSPRCGWAGEVSCSCVEGRMVQDMHDPMECHINPPEGETSTITIKTEGYEEFETEVTLPYTCGPREHVDVLLIPEG